MTSSQRITHAELCATAANWLKRSAGCGVVISEMVSFAGEVPDAIGWRDGISILIEVKTSRADFVRDARKPWRGVSNMGDWRFYFTEPGLLRAEEMPRGWGLLEVHGKQVRRIHGVPKGNIWSNPPNWGYKHSEVLLLCSALRRLSS